MSFETPDDQLRTYTLMLANTNGAPVYWLHFAQIYGEIPGQPVLLLGRAQTCAVIIVRRDGPRAIRILYREAGLYFGPDGDEPISQFRNPVSGKVLPIESAFREGPGVFTCAATDAGIIGNSELDPKTIRKLPWTWRSSGPQLSLTNDNPGTFAPGDPTSDSVQARSPLSGRILQTWHADMRDVARTGAVTAPCFKNYVVATSAWPAFLGDPGAPGTSFIRGMGAKLRPDEAEAYPEFQRLKRVHGDFFAAAGEAR